VTAERSPLWDAAQPEEVSLERDSSTPVPCSPAQVAAKIVTSEVIDGSRAAASHLARGTEAVPDQAILPRSFRLQLLNDPGIHPVDVAETVPGVVEDSDLLIISKCGFRMVPVECSVAGKEEVSAVR